MALFFYTNDLSLATLAGTERIPLDQAAGGSEYTTPNAIEAFVQPTIVAAALAAVLAAYGSVLTLPNAQYTAETHTAGFTASGGDVAGARHVVLDLTGTLAAGASLQMPTAAVLVAAIPNAAVGETYVLRVVNNSSANFAWTLTVNTGITLAGTVAVAQNTWREWLVTLTSLTAVSLQNIGSGTN